jgi:hypothetical protein
VKTREANRDKRGRGRWDGDKKSGIGESERLTKGRTSYCGVLLACDI